VDAVPRNSFVRVRGLPPTAALTEGYSIAPGSWSGREIVIGAEIPPTWRGGHAL